MSSSSTSRDAQGSIGRNPSSTSLATGKASAAPPKLSTRENELELKDIKPDDGNSNNPKPSLPVEEDIMQLSRLGEIGAIQKLFESGKFNARYTDEEGITPLHVSNTRNNYPFCVIWLEWEKGFVAN